MKHRLILVILILSVCILSCSPENTERKTPEQKAEKEFFVVPGEDEDIDLETIRKGQILVAYSDCYQCHKEKNKAMGPSFSDIARRYPIREAIIDMLARKIISGGYGTWGYPVMSAHPKVPIEDARAMVTYVLSLEEK